jgi:hypothetical protein
MPWFIVLPFFAERFWEYFEHEAQDAPAIKRRNPCLRQSAPSPFVNYLPDSIDIQDLFKDECHGDILPELSARELRRLLSLTLGFLI